ncbi:MAG: radical SAM protein [Candidatus Omnitrophica bacterium]|nr:radical SAM protein [Candidatus Omnitrophota bacterium]
MEYTEEQKINADKSICPVPTFSCFTLCDDCILRCRMCEKWKPDIHIKPERKQLGQEDWKRCAVSLKKIAPENFVINFGGGEVTTVPWLFEIVSFCHDLGFKTNIATNGYLMDEEKAKKMSESGLDYVNISLDSIDETLHDELRGVKGTYAKVINAIDLINKYAPNTQISLCSIMMADTIDGMVELVNWAQDNEKVAMIYLMAIMQPNNTMTGLQWYKNEFSHLWPKDYCKVKNTIDELIELKKKGFKISNPVEHLQAYKTYFSDPQTYVKKSNCNIDHALHISSVGDVFMCYSFDKIGDAREDCVENLWKSDKAEDIRKQIRACKENCHFLLNCNFKD